MFDFADVGEAVAVERAQRDHPIDHAEAAVALLQLAAALQLAPHFRQVGKNHLRPLAERFHPLQNCCQKLNNKKKVVSFFELKKNKQEMTGQIIIVDLDSFGLDVPVGS